MGWSRGIECSGERIAPSGHGSWRRAALDGVAPRELVQPYSGRVSQRAQQHRVKLTGIFCFLVNLDGNTTLVHLLCRLDGECGAIGDDPIRGRASVHRPLQRISLPAEHVVSVLSVPSSVIEGGSTSATRNVKAKGTHGSPMLKMKGWSTPSGHQSRWLKGLVSQLISMNRRGRRTG